jgi:hypothetical protein
MRIPGLGRSPGPSQKLVKAAQACAGRMPGGQPPQDSEFLRRLAGRDAARAAARRFPPATQDQLRAAEASLSFPLPPLLGRIYTTIANGGFGPGRGLIGLPGGATDEHGNSILDLYDSFSASSEEDPEWQWPDRLVPICGWTESVYSCVDCLEPAGAVVGFDLTGYEPGRSVKEFLLPQSPTTLEAWLRAWAEGVDLWEEMFPLQA